MGESGSNFTYVQNYYNRKKKLYAIVRNVYNYLRNDAIVSADNLAADKIDVLYFGVNDAGKSGIKTGPRTKGKREEGESVFFARFAIFILPKFTHFFL